MKPAPKVAAEAKSLANALSDGKNTCPIIPGIGDVDGEVEELKPLPRAAAKDALRSRNDRGATACAN